MKVIVTLIVAVSISTSVSAQSKKAQDVMNIASWIAAAAVLTNDALACHGDKRCLAFMGIRVGASIGAAEGIKHLFPAPRPCAPADCGFDNPFANMPSEHAWLVASAIDYTGCTPGPKLAVQLPLAFFTDLGRWTSKRHTVAALAAGTAGGFVASILTRCK